MLRIEKINTIRRMYFEQKVAIRAIARELDISRNTVRRWIRDDRTPQMRRHPVELSSEQLFLREHREDIRRIFAACHQSCPRVLEELEKTYNVKPGLRMVQRFCQEFRNEKEAAGAETSAK